MRSAVRKVVPAAAAAFAVSAAFAAEVSVSPFLLPAGKTVIGPETTRLDVNLPLFRRVMLSPEDLESAAVSIAADAPPARIACAASGRDVGPGAVVDFAKALPDGIRLEKGEKFAFAAWKSSWHWHGGAEISGFKASLKGAVSYAGLSKREGLPEVREIGPVASKGSGVRETPKGVVLSSNGRASFDAGYDWAPALVFTAEESGVCRFSGKMSFSAAGDKPAMSWLLGKLHDAAPSVKGLRMDFHRILKPGKGPVAEGDFDPAPLWTATFGKDIRFSGDVASAVRKWLSGEWKYCGVCARVTGPDGAGGAVRFTRDVYAKAKVRDYPHHTLFDAPVKIKPGVYAERRDGRLYYDGRRLRLWSMVKDGTGERYRQMGMNGWRAWFGEDFYSAESAKEGRPMDYVKGDGSKLDRFDARFADMKAHDVFVMFGTLIGLGMDAKHFAADGSWLHARHRDDPDWKEWQAAALKVGRGCELLAYLDDRLWEVKLRHAENVLDHVNPHTGRRYAEDEAIVLVEINNEAGHVKKWVEYGFEKLPDFFKREIAAKREKEDDLQRFLVETVDRRNREFIAFCRARAPKGVGVNAAAFSCDSIYRPSVPWLWADAQGDSSTVSMYFWRNDSMLAEPPSFYVLDSSRLDGKMNVVYETGRGRPSRYRAETPYSLAVLADWQDFDIVDWHGSWFGGKSNEELLAQGVQPPGTSHYWDAVHLEFDPVMTSAIAMAGRLYLAGVIGTAEDPCVYTLGPSAVYGKSCWNGIGDADASRRTFTRGTKLRFDPEQKEPLLVDGRPPVAVPEPAGPVKTGRYVTWDWPNGRLVVDAPQAKVYIGPTVDSFAFSDGIVISGFDTPWIAFSLISRDGRPLAESAGSAWASAVFDARNTGFDYDETVAGGPVEQAKAVKSRGHAPVVVTPVSYAVSFPRQTDLRYTAYDFALRKTRSAEKNGGNALVMEAQTDWMGVVEFTRRGGPQAPTVRPSPGVARAAAAGANGKEGLSGEIRKLLPPGVEFRCARDLPGATSLEFTTSISFKELAEALTRKCGNPVSSSLTANAFEQSEVKWTFDGAPGKVSVKLTETQGVIRLLAERH